MLKVDVFLLHICRILHLAIIHEEEFIAQQLIQLFPKNVLDIQNNLYQVSLTSLFLTTSSFYWNFLLPSGFLSVVILFLETLPLFLFVLLEKRCSSLWADWERRHCGWFQWQLFRGFEWKIPSSNSCRNRITESGSLYGSGWRNYFSLSTYQTISWFVQEPKWNWAKSHLLKVKN